KPIPVQERIIEERRTQRAGAQIAQAFLRDEEKFLRWSLRNDEKTPENRLHQMVQIWFIEYLKNPRNATMFLKIVRDSFR
ncbi:MAG: hypothetical protein Q7R47_04095, partial [Candidatus Diapherotrites archaeon]|nr:hypothetical protein [Candidatus Diapherotrites archaeon]